MAIHEGLTPAKLAALRDQYTSVEGPENERYGNATGAASFPTYGGALVPEGLDPNDPDYEVLKLMRQTDYELSLQGTHEADVKQRNPWANGLFFAVLAGGPAIPFLGWGAAGVAVVALVGTRIVSEVMYRHEDAQYAKAMTRQLEATSIQNA